MSARRMLSVPFRRAIRSDAHTMATTTTVAILLVLIAGLVATTRLDDIEDEVRHFDRQLAKSLDYQTRLELNLIAPGQELNEQHETASELIYKWTGKAQLFSWWLQCTKTTPNLKITEACFYLQHFLAKFTTTSTTTNVEFHANMAKLLEEKNQLAIEFNDHIYRSTAHVDQLMSRETNPSRLEGIWRAWSKQTSKLSSTFHDTIKSIENGEEYWRHFIPDLGLSNPSEALPLAKHLWTQVEEFHRLLVDYLIARLDDRFQHYEFGPILSQGMLPIHLTRSVTGTQLNSLLDWVRPYSNVGGGARIQWNNNTTIDNLKQYAEKIYQQFGFPPLGDNFWQQTKLIRPAESVDCQSSVNDLFETVDGVENIRMKICSYEGDPTFERKLLHELGHAHFLRTYQNRSTLYKLYVNRAVHESIGETVALANAGCEIKEELTRVNITTGKMIIIDRLLEEALTSFVRIPYALALEQWRHDVIIDEWEDIESMNRHYWHLRARYEHIARQNDQGPRVLDPLSKLHIVGFIPYLRYLFATFLAHQQHEMLCGGQMEALVLCCPSDAKRWDSFRDYMKTSIDHSLLGRSVNYRAEALLRYYKPLIGWLRSWHQQR